MGGAGEVFDGDFDYLEAGAICADDEFGIDEGRVRLQFESVEELAFEQLDGVHVFVVNSVKCPQHEVVDLGLEEAARWVVAFDAQTDDEVVCACAFDHGEEFFGGVLVVAGEREDPVFAAGVIEFANGFAEAHVDGVVDEAYARVAGLHGLEDFEGGVLAPVVDADNLVVIADVAKESVGIDDETFDGGLVVVRGDDYRDRGDRQSSWLF